MHSEFISSLLFYQSNARKLLVGSNPIFRLQLFWQGYIYIYIAVAATFAVVMLPWNDFPVELKSF
jgi:hypothetical protein